MTRRFITRYVCLLLLWSLVGCASVPLAPSALDQAAKQFQPPSGQALLYVVRRPSSFDGILVVFQVAVDGTILGSLAPGTYLVLLASPGAHRVTAWATQNQVALTVDIQEGHPAFVHVSPRVGLMYPRVGLELLDDTAGREAVLAGALAQGLAGP